MAAERGLHPDAEGKSLGSTRSGSREAYAQMLKVSLWALQEVAAERGLCPDAEGKSLDATRSGSMAAERGLCLNTSGT